MSDLIVLSPLGGWAAPLDEVPDPVFAGRLMGDGVAVDPTDTTIVAPFDGEVVSLASTAHAFAVRADDGVEVLVHVGLETVALGGRGFALSVRQGQRVRAGETLGRFDLDVLAAGARSLISPVIVTALAGRTLADLTTGRDVAAGQPLMRLSAGVATDTTAVVGGGETRRVEIVLALPHGLHARPAARLAQAAKAFQAEIAVETAGRSANAKSPVALMSLGLGAAPQGVRLTLTARGPDAAAALDQLRALMAGGLGEDAHAPTSLQPLPAAVAPPTGPGVCGVTGAPGLAVGPSFRFRRAEVAVTEAGLGVVQETGALAAARATVSQALREEAAAAPTAALRDVLDAHLELLDDPDLDAAVGARLAKGESAGFAWRAAIQAQADQLSALADPRLAARADDLTDIGRRVLLALGGEPAPASAPPQGSIVLADDLLPSEIVALIGTAAGVCTARGGPTSHVAILAAGAGLPLVVAAGAVALAASDGTPAILDADRANLRLHPPEADLADARARLDRRAAARAAAHADAAEPCRLADGTRIEVFANLGSVEDAAAAVAAGAEGCGLLRTEFLFLDRDTAPDEDEQAETYQAIAEALDGRPLIVRTLDIGGDKPIPYLPLPREENPALGLRGVRTSLWRPELMKAQLRAILRVRSRGPVRIMVPMVASQTELIAVRAMLDEAMSELAPPGPIDLGVMVETPAAAATTALLAASADFFSIGTNDLTQYVLAMDRGNPATAAALDALHPAVLRMIALACEGAAQGGRWIGLCGGLASEPLAAPLLVGLGVGELSATPAAIPEIKARLRGVTMDDCRRLATEALTLGAAADVRAHLAAAAEAGGARP